MSAEEPGEIEIGEIGFLIFCQKGIKDILGLFVVFLLTVQKT